MYSYLIGTVVEMNIDHIVVENSGIGYLIYVNNPYEYTRGKEIKIFLYQQVKEDALLLYGFKTSEEKEMFLKLILVKGIGCKTAIGNVAYLKKIPGIGPKAAQQIILDLQGKFKNTPTATTLINNNDLDEAAEVLIALGYKKSEVDKALAVLLNEKLDTNGYVKRALSLLVK